ncbi:hypothetical protein FUAX_20200 [Fulvitalea axinellae]|uniref:Uncharacterized protein n=1 Tax=Fulvitalea axinellae TaxID=1182444 RepID=A0AAU9CNG6_9BACT|nr:hypothetical protein FUAX_20200 [Fulvitalea axinellae]
MVRLEKRYSSTYHQEVLFIIKVTTRKVIFEISTIFQGSGNKDNGVSDLASYLEDSIKLELEDFRRVYYSNGPVALIRIAVPIARYETVLKQIDSGISGFLGSLEVHKDTVKVAKSYGFDIIG